MRRKVEIRCTGLGSFRQLGNQLLSSLQIFSKYLLGTHDVPYLAKALETQRGSRKGSWAPAPQKKSSCAKPRMLTECAEL